MIRLGVQRLGLPGLDLQVWTHSAEAALEMRKELRSALVRHGANVHGRLAAIRHDVRLAAAGDRPDADGAAAENGIAMLGELPREAVADEANDLDHLVDRVVSQLEPSGMCRVAVRDEAKMS